MPILRAGVGAKVSILTKFIHPSEHVRTKHPNLEKQHRTEGVLIGREEKTVTRRLQECYTFRSGDFEGHVMHAVKRYVKIVEEGGEADLFDAPEAPEDNPPVQQEGGQEEAVAEVPNAQQNAPEMTGELAEDINAMRAAGATVDDDNEPAEENIPAPAANNEDSPFEDEWGFKGVCFRKKDGHLNRNASISMHRNVWESMKPLDWFLLFFPINYVRDTMLPAMNENLDKGRPKIQLWEYIRWLGLWMMMSTTDGHERKHFFESNKAGTDERFDGPPFRLNDLMSGRRFDEILRVHKTYSQITPQFKDRFHPVRQFLDAWNENMADHFVPSWVVCLDESMSLWTNMFTCPGFVFCPRKPWETGNEYHTIACGLTSIIFHMELVEGKDRPSQLPPLQYVDRGGKTVGLLLRMTKPIHNTGRLVILDSGFCVLKGLVELGKVGLFASALIKKRRYWPKYIRGEEIKEHFKDKAVGEVDAWPGKIDDVPFYVFSMKEPDYVMNIMSTYGTCNETDSKTKRIYKNENNEEVSVEFNYTEVFRNHYKFRHVVDDNNNNRMQPISIEETWGTKDWSHRPYAYAMGVSVVNAQRGYELLGQKEKTSTLAFRRRLARELIYNSFMPTTSSGREESKRDAKKRKVGECQLVSLPPYRCFSGANIVECNGRYNQYTCVCTAMRVRTYCECSPGFIRCSKCFVEHCMEVEKVK